MCGPHHSGRRSRDRYSGEAIDRRQRDFVADATKFGSIVLLCVAIWLLSGAGYFWPAWVIVIGGLRLGFQAREVYGARPEAEIDA
jgi:hypothetical protein